MKKPKINSKSIFYFTYILFLIANMFSNVKFISNFLIYLPLLVIVNLIILLFINLKKLSQKEILFIFLTLILVFISSRFVQNNSIFILYLFIINSKELELKDFIKKSYSIKFVFLLFIIFLYFMGMTNNYIMHREDGIVRSSMGFSHPNIFGLYVFSIFCEYLYINHNKINTLLLTLFSLTVAFLIMYFSDSRGSFISIMFLYSVILLHRFDLFKIFDSKIIKTIINYSFIFAAMISLFFSLKYIPTNPFYKNLDSLLSGRIRMANRFLNNYDIHFLGNKLELVSTYVASVTGKQALILDNAYIKLILQYGINVFVLFMFSYIKVSKKMYNKKNYIFVIIFFTYVIRGLTENILFTFYGNAFLIYLSYALFRKNIEKE